MNPPLLSLTPQILADRIGPGRSRAIFRSLAHGRDPHTDDEVAPGLRERLSKAARWHPPVERLRSRSPDGTTKLLYEVEGGYRVETVLIPARGRTTLCVSSQVGCLRGCRFCLTSTMGLVRNLLAQDIVAQVHLGLRVGRELDLPPLRNLVFMGMGEPLDNWKAVAPAIDVLIDGRGFGFGPRHLTVSTVGPSPSRIERLSGCRTRLAWSLHSAVDEVRRQLVATQRHSVQELTAAWRRLFVRRKDPLFVEMTLVRGLNDADRYAEAARALFEDFPTEVRFNLLPVNPTVRGFEPSEQDRVERFAHILRSGGHFTMVRAARGQEKRAACGQLAVLGQP